MSAGGKGPGCGGSSAYLELGVHLNQPVDQDSAHLLVDLFLWVNIDGWVQHRVETGQQASPRTWSSM
jgi:hypothetical protein